MSTIQPAQPNDFMLLARQLSQFKCTAMSFGCPANDRAVGGLLVPNRPAANDLKAMP